MNENDRGADECYRDVSVAQPAEASDWPGIPSQSLSGFTGDRNRSPGLIGRFRASQTVQTCSAFGVALVVAIGVSHAIADWIKLPKPRAVYRRIGPTTGPQVFCAGSSLLQFGLAWPEISEELGQGIENWGLGGSSPTEWEVSQRVATNTNLMIIGFSVHDFNENYLCESRANLVPVTETVEDLWRSKADWEFSKRVLKQYPLAYLRKLFPTAERSDAVLVGLRRKLRALAGLSPTADDQAGSLVMPRQPVLNFGGSTAKLSNWPSDKALRRLTVLRGEIHGGHRFGGPKALAFLRMLKRAEKRGRAIVVIMPVAPLYADEFLNPDIARSFEEVLSQAQQAAPQARFVRLDRLPALKSNEYYSDFIHLNGDGKRIATDVFLQELRKDIGR